MPLLYNSQTRKMKLKACVVIKRRSKKTKNHKSRLTVPLRGGRVWVRGEVFRNSWLVGLGAGLTGADFLINR